MPNSPLNAGNYGYLQRLGDLVEGALRDLHKPADPRSSSYLLRPLVTPWTNMRCCYEVAQHVSTSSNSSHACELIPF
jgi:hypothetical protein